MCEDEPQGRSSGVSREGPLTGGEKSQNLATRENEAAHAQGEIPNASTPSLLRGGNEEERIYWDAVAADFEV